MRRYDDGPETNGGSTGHDSPSLDSIDQDKFVAWLDNLRTNRLEQFRDYIDTMHGNVFDQLVELLLKRAVGQPEPTREELIILAIGFPARHTLYSNITWKMPYLMRLTALKLFKAIAEKVDDEKESQQMYLSLHSADRFVDKSCSIWPAIVQAAIEVREKHIRRFTPVASTNCPSGSDCVKTESMRTPTGVVISSNRFSSPPTASAKPAGVTISAASRSARTDRGDDFDPHQSSQVFPRDAQHVERQGDQ